jgi:L-seryl-tRNA(Ser) seleniumtransferase
MEDLGSGTLIDFSRYGLAKEPTVQESLTAGVDVVTFSGDKLLGGPQTGIILGSKPVIDRIKANPLTRALRVDKMTLAALETTLSLYRDEKEAIGQIPTLRMLTMPLSTIQARAADLKSHLDRLPGHRLEIALSENVSKAGGGSLPLLELPTCCVGVSVRDITANTVEKWMRHHSPPIVGRIEEDRFIMDPRTLQEEELVLIEQAFEALLAHFSKDKVDHDTQKS